MEKSKLKENTVHGTNVYPFAVYQWSGHTGWDKINCNEGGRRIKVKIRAVLTQNTF